MLSELVKKVTGSRIGNGLAGWGLHRSLFQNRKTYDSLPESLHDHGRVRLMMLAGVRREGTTSSRVDDKTARPRAKDCSPLTRRQRRLKRQMTSGNREKTAAGTIGALKKTKEMLCWQRGSFGCVVRIGVQQRPHGPLGGRTVVSLGKAEERR